MKTSFTLRALVLSTILLLAFGVTSVIAQAFTVDPMETMNVTLQATGDQVTEVQFPNQTQNSITLEWETVTDAMPTSWYTELCDFGSCFIGDLPDSWAMGPIGVGAWGLFRFKIDPLGNTDTIGQAVFNIWVSGDRQGTERTVTFNFNVLTDVEEPQAPLFSMYPNPVAHELHFELPDGPRGRYTLTDLSGRVL
ncbi:MAG: hypothetical protein AAF570_29530, partial [Bacteroidota bacterium]